MTLSANIVMANDNIITVLDTNVIISAVLSDKLCRAILHKVFDKEIVGVTSLVLIDELNRVLQQKFHLGKEVEESLNSQIKESFIIETPLQTISIVSDETDNRVVEAAISGNADYIISGDKHLLDLKKYQKILIVTPAEFLEKYND